MELRRPEERTPDERNEEIKKDLDSQQIEEARSTEEALPAEDQTQTDPAEDTDGPGEEDTPRDGLGSRGSQGNEASSRPTFVFKDRRVFASDLDDLEDEEPSSDKPTYVEQLEKRVEEAEARLAEYIKAYKEKTEVEWAELKARLERDMERQVLQARKQMVLDLLEVLDNFTRTIDSARTAADIQTLITGVEMIERQFLSKLQALGLEPIQAEGEVFDPNKHEAAGVQETDDENLDGRIVEVYRQGYSFGGALLRPALVRVAKKRPS